METVRGRDFEHSQMHRRILVPGEADVANLPRLFRIHQRFERPAGGEEAVGIFHPDVLVKLNQVDVIRLQSSDTFERFFTLGSNIERIESRSLTGVSLIKIYFKPGTDANAALSNIANLAMADLRRL